MNANAKTWIKALRSGKYEQGTGKLVRDGKYCCLGAACDLAADELGLDRSDGFYEDTRRSGGLMPHSVKTWLGLRATTNLWEFADLNDDCSLKNDFAKIADHIEQHQDRLFESA